MDSLSERRFGCLCKQTFAHYQVVEKPHEPVLILHWNAGEMVRPAVGRLCTYVI
jgi:hypothetical protein